MDMSAQRTRTTSRVFYYGVASAVGLSFAVTLFMYAWQNSIENATRNFELQAVALNAAVDRNVRAIDEAVTSIASYFRATANFTEESFEVFARVVLERNNWIDAVSYFRMPASAPESPRDLPRSVALDQLTRLPVRYQLSRSGSAPFPPHFDLSSVPQLRDGLATAVETSAAVPLAPFRDGPYAGSYLVIKTVTGLGNAPTSATEALVAVLVNPARILNVATLQEDVSVTLRSESSGVIGRQQLFSRKAGPGGRVIRVLEQESRIQFPHYSMRLTLSKPVLWSDLDQGLLLTTFVLGVGITLLITALAHAKEAQERELRARNEEIERQVQRQTRELAIARDQALEASRVKSDFLASMSHEIRTPLNAIIGMAELLSETTLTADQDKYVTVFRRAGEALLSLVNDILDLSKIEAGQLVLEEVEFDLREIIEHAVEIYALKCSDKGIELAAHIATDIPLRLIGDPGRLRQIVLNLIGNAIKFTERGEIVVRVTRESSDGSADRLLFAVSDTGIGIPEHKLESIFASFTQADSSTTRKYGGTGLGLTISKRLVELMGGRIWVQSVIGRGSTFHFTLPLAVAEAQETPRPPAPVELGGLRVLVIDDNATNRLILEEVLTSHGALVTTADGADAGLDAFERARGRGESFDLILTDCRMPDKDGFDVAQSIKSAGGKVNTVMMLTSENLGSDVARVREIGIGGYLVKPVKWAELFEAINRALGQSAVAPAPASEAPRAMARRSNAILLVEDTSDNRLLIKAYLKKEPYEIDEAENGEIAVEMFKSREYGLVLMDVQMPVMDGHQATRLIREWEREQGRPATPIIALTAHAIKEDMEKSLRAGCTAHLTKPIKKTTLLQVIGQYLGAEAA
jgi:signal transduction histidine kinase/DNA-binding response OmpR family regulator